MPTARTGTSFLKGEELLQQGRYDEALVLFESLLDVQPDDVDVLVNFGVAALGGGSIERGLDAHLRALHIDPTNRPALDNLSFLAKEPEVADWIEGCATEILKGNMTHERRQAIIAALSTVLDPAPNENPAASPAIASDSDGRSSSLRDPASTTGGVQRQSEASTNASFHVQSEASTNAGVQRRSEAPSKANYRVDKELGMVFKNDERVRDYVSLQHHLRRNDISIGLKDLVQYLQFTFQKLIGTYFNTTRLPESYVHTIGSILERMKIEHNVSIELAAGTEAEFVYSIYHFLNERLPASSDDRRITISSSRETLARPETTDDVRTLYRALQTAFEPLDQNHLVSLFVVHGSYSTLDFTPFSDVDTQLFLTDLAFDSPEMIVEVAKLITRNNHYLRTFDPLQHHGYFVATDMDRRSYPEPFLPVEALRQATRVFGDESQGFSVNRVVYADRFSAWHMGHYFRLSFLSGRFPQTPHDTKQYLSRFSLLPVLYLELVDEIYPYKGDVFKGWDKHFTPEQWTPFHVVTRARQNWNPQRGASFGSSFHQGVFEFAELLLDKLSDQHQ